MSGGSFPLCTALVSRWACNLGAYRRLLHFCSFSCQSCVDSFQDGSNLDYKGREARNGALGANAWPVRHGCKLQEDKDSSFERPVLFVGVRSKAEGANLQEALADALSGHDNLPSRECDSRFDMEKIR
jgi:hypothetical protein